MASAIDDNPPEDAAASESSDAPRELNRLEVLRGLRLSIWEAAFSTVWAALTTGAFLTGYALWLGADNVAMGLVTAIPTFAGLIQIVSSYLGERLSSRKSFVAWFALAGRTLWLPILLLPLVFHSAALYPFLLLLALSYICLNVTVPAWTAWMTDLVPADHRGRYFARRNMIAGIVGMVIALPAAWFLDVATRRHHWESFGFGALFGVAVVTGLFSFATLLRQPEPHRPPPPEEALPGVKGVLDFYRAPLADRNFRRLILFNTIFGLGQNFAAPFFTVYALKNLHLNYVWLQTFATLNSVTGLASMPLWGYLADKFGNKPLMTIGIVGVFTLPIGWFFTTPQHFSLTLLLLILVHAGGGLFWAGFNLSQFNLLIRLSPSDKTSVYVATMAAVTGLTGGLAPLVGGATMRALEGWTGNLFGMAIQNFHVTFLIAACLRLGSLLFLKPIVDESATSTRDVLQQLGQVNPRTWQHIRHLQRGSDAASRLRAMEALAGTRTRLALGELESALGDPSMAVREEATRALGEIGDPGSVEALLAALRDPATGLADEAAHALGRIGDRRANEALIAVLREGHERYSRRDRIAAARALGDLGGPDAAEALLASLQTIANGEDEEMAETLVHALGQVGDRRATPTLVALLEDSGTPRPLRVATVRALGELRDPSALPALKAALAAFDSDPALLPLLADALARLEATEAVLPLLGHLAQIESPVARKQVAHAIATLLGEGEAVYTLLSLEAYARDSAISRLVGEMQKLPHLTPAATRTLQVALKTYTEGNYTACLRALGRVARALPLQPSQNRFRTDREALVRRVLEHTAGEASVAVSLEGVLIAFSLLHSLVTAV
jgi:HEAT repeat protein/MFS family permease